MEQLLPAPSHPSAPRIRGGARYSRALRRLAALGRRLEYRMAEAFHRVPFRRSPLEMSHLETLQARYPFRQTYGYDADSLRKRGEARAAEILLLPGAATARRFLELGCMDGLVSGLLSARGKDAVGIDIEAGAFNPDARAMGAAFAQMDAGELALADASIDVAFSYNAFEHFADPARVLRELTRVLAPGGLLYLRFGPLYYSPWGEHAYRTITVPYCHLLFPRRLMNDYAVQHGMRPLKDGHVNGWSLEQYHQLWRAAEPSLERIQYEEREDLAHLGIVRRYHGCFRHHAPSFRNYVVSHIRAVFRKR